ncbi:MAG: class I SAM-dependent methyltransferase [Anaerolineae bacterium]
MMETLNKGQDKHFPVFLLTNPLRKLFGNAKKFNQYVQPGQTVADLGSGPGYFTFSLADAVGPAGLVYAVDSDANAIRALARKAEQGGFRQVSAHTSTSAHLEFIPSRSVDFVLGYGLICCVAPGDHAGTVSEIKRILKPTGQAYLTTERSRFTYVDDAEWERILGEFEVVARNTRYPRVGERWALLRLPGA